MTAVEQHPVALFPVDALPAARPAEPDLGVLTDGLPAIDLAELTEVAGLQTRVDRKYLVPTSALPALRAALPAGTRRLVVDGRDRVGYRSVYFDTPDLAAFRLAAGRRRRRFKVRTRRYDTGGCWVEVKTRGARGATVKDRCEHPADPRRLAGGAPFVRRTLRERCVDLPEHVALAPSLTTAYDRTTLHLPDGARVTVDADLTWGSPDDLTGLGSAAPGAVLAGGVVVETKSTGAVGAADRVLRDLGHRPVRLSKYATGLLLLDPDLAGRPWRRTLRALGRPDDPTGDL